MKITMNKAIFMALFIACCASNIVATELIDAVKAGNGARVEELVRQGADGGERDENGQTALMYAAKTGRSIIIQLLCLPRADIDACIGGDIQDSEGKTALMYAAEQGHLEAVRTMLSSWHANIGCTINTVDRHGYNALMYAAKAPKNSLEVVKLLLKNGACNSKKAYTLAVQSGNKATARAILDYRRKKPINTAIEKVKRTAAIARFHLGL